MMCIILSLPSEILTTIVRYANLNGDLLRVQASSVTFRDIVVARSLELLEDLCLKYEIHREVLDAYVDIEVESVSTLSALPRHMQQLQAFQAFLHTTEILASDVGATLNRVPMRVERRPLVQSREPLMLFAIFSRNLRSSMAATSTSVPDVLVARGDGTDLAQWRFSASFLRYAREAMKLEDLESVISAVNICTMELWTYVFMSRRKELTIQSFGSLSGASFNHDQAVLTEHVIWHGLSWIAQIFSAGGRLRNKRVLADDDALLREKIWKGSSTDAARLAANGVARWLWKERQRKIELSWVTWESVQRSGEALLAICKCREVQFLTLGYAELLLQTKMQEK